MSVLERYRVPKKILRCRALLKVGYDYWLEDTDESQEVSVCEETRRFMETLEEKEVEIAEATLSSESEEVAYYIAGNIAKRITRDNNCEQCKIQLIGYTDDEDAPWNSYLLNLSRGGLTVPSREFFYFISNGYALLDLFEEHIGNSARHISLIALEKYCQNSAVGCQAHKEKNRRFSFKVIVNTFFNNKQKQSTDAVRQDAVKSFKQRQRRKESGRT